MIPRAPESLREGFSKWIDDFNEIRGLFSEMLEEEGDANLAAFLRSSFDGSEVTNRSELPAEYCQALSIVFFNCWISLRRIPPIRCAAALRIPGGRRAKPGLWLFNLERYSPARIFRSNAAGRDGGTISGRTRADGASHRSQTRDGPGASSRRSIFCWWSGITVCSRMLRRLFSDAAYRLLRSPSACGAPVKFESIDRRSKAKCRASCIIYDGCFPLWWNCSTSGFSIPGRRRSARLLRICLGWRSEAGWEGTATGIHW